MPELSKQIPIDTVPTECAEAADKWQKENQDALEVLNRFHEEHGSFSEEYRAFWTTGFSTNQALMVFFYG